MENYGLVVSDKSQGPHLSFTLQYNPHAPTNSILETILYPTFCQTTTGLRLFGTLLAIDKNGNTFGELDAVPDANKWRLLGKSLANLGNPLRCQTVQLTSKLI